MNIFDEEELLSLNKGTKRREKRAKLYEGVVDILNELDDKQSMKSEVEKNNEAVFNEEVNQAVKNNKMEEAKVLNETSMLEEQVAEDMFVQFLVEATVESLNIDKQLIDHNQEYVSAKVKDFYKGVKHLLNFNNNVSADIVASFNKSARRVNEEVSFATAYSHLEPLSIVVKEKVARVIEEEKAMADLESKLEENVYAHDVEVRMTLFREMEIENVKEAVRELEEAGKEIVKEDVMLVSFYETVVEYTMLEVFNTLELLPFNQDLCINRKHKRFKEIL